MRSLFTTVGILAILTVIVCFTPHLHGAPGSGGPSDPQISGIRKVLPRPAATDYRIFAVRIGRTETAHRNLFIRDVTLPKQIEIAFAFWVIAGNGRVILVDTGFVNRAMVETWRIQDYLNPVDALAAAGFRPDQVTDIIVTHTHWDHIGGLGCFPDARLIVPKKIASLPADDQSAVARAVRRAKKENRLHAVSQMQQVAPGVAVIPVGLHRPEFQLAAVRNQDGFWVLASDVTPLYANYKRNRPTGQTDDPKATLALQRTLLKLVDGDLSRIVPGHEPSLFENADSPAVELTRFPPKP